MILCHSLYYVHEVSRCPYSQYNVMVCYAGHDLLDELIQNVLMFVQVCFGDYTGGQCKEMWGRIQKRLRRFRLLREVLEDAKLWVSKPWTNFYRSQKLVCFIVHTFIGCIKIMPETVWPHDWDSEIFREKMYLKHCYKELHF